MLRIAKYLHGRFWLLVSWLIIATAILLTLLRLFLPFVDLTPYKKEIEHIAEEAAGMPLLIGSMHMELHGAHLALSFSDVSLLDPETGLARLHFREAHADIRLLASLLNHRLTFGGAMVSGTSLRIIRRWDGSFMVNGFQESSAGAPGSVAGFFLRGTRLRVRDSVVYWLDEKSEMPAIRFTHVNVDLLNGERRHQLRATLSLGEQSEQSLQLMADLREGRPEPMQMHGRFYLKTHGVELAGRLGERLTRGLEVDGGRVDLELWGKLGGGSLERLEGQIKLTDLKLKTQGGESLELDRVSSLLVWQTRQPGWRLDLDQLVLVHDRLLWPPGRLSIADQSDAAGHRAYQLSADYVGLREFSRALVLLLQDDSKLRGVLLGLSPAGHLTSLRMAFDRQPGLEDLWRVSGSVTQYRNRPWKAVPGVSGLSLKFEGDQQGGDLLLGSQGLVMEMPGLFRGKLSADRLDGHFKWGFSAEQGLNLKTSGLYVGTRHVQTLSRLGLHIPLNGETSQIDMQTDFWNGDAAQKSRYLPVGIMPEALVNWLDRAIVGGRINAGSMLLYGPLNAFPYIHNEGRFEVLFGIEQLVLDYMPDWPRLEEGVAEAHFLNNSLSIQLSAGMLLNSELRYVKADISNLRQASPVQIRSVVDGPMTDLFRILSETPLQQRFGAFTREVSVSGQASTSLDLSIPLRHGGELKTVGKVGFKQASLLIKEQDLRIEKIDGDLHFNDKEVWGEAIEGRLLDRLAEFKITPEVQQGRRMTRISSNLEVSTDWLRKREPVLDFLQGRVPAAVALDIPHEPGDLLLRLAVQSDLKGTEVELPAPLGKGPETLRDTRVILDFLKGGRSELKIAYSDLLQALLVNSGKGYDRANLRFGTGSLVPLEQPGIGLQGESASLDLGSWLTWLDRHRREEHTSDKLSLDVDLRVDDLVLAGAHFSGVKIKGGTVAAGWRVKLASDDLAGSLSLLGDLEGRAVNIHLNQLKLKLADVIPARKSARHTAGYSMHPAKLPALDMVVDSLSLDDIPLGRLLIKWHKVPLGLQLSQLTLNGELVNLRGEGYWHLVGKHQTTHLDLHGRVESLGELQHDFGLQIGIEEAPMSFDAKLNWSEPPYALSLDKLEGALKIDVDEGEITDVDPGMGRLVGLFGLHALGKRLMLDFSDLFSDGLVFDQIKGDFELADGNAYTSDLEMSGPAVKVVAAGRVGLAARDYDEWVTVTPRVSSTLPIVGALAVNPAAGLLLAAAQQLLGKQMDRITETEYHLTGSWEDPKIEKKFKKVKPNDLTEELLDLE